MYAKSIIHGSKSTRKKNYYPTKRNLQESACACLKDNEEYKK